MQSAAVLLSGFLLAAPGAPAQPLAEEVKSVYVMPMARGLDQHLANHLRKVAGIQVVADPKRADAVLTERLGPVLETRLEEIRPKAEAPKPDSQRPSIEAAPVPASTFGRGKGTIFLVSTRSRAVLWSTFEPVKSFRPGDLDHTAERIVERFGRDITRKK